ncbi:hypothetical protein [Roseateles sp. P5_E11]
MGQPRETQFDADGPDDIKRKYLAEAGLNLYSDAPVMFRPSDIYRLGKDPGFREVLRGSNVYLICRRRRISIDPVSLKVKGGDLYGDFLVHGEGYQQWQREPFTFTPAQLGRTNPPTPFLAVRPDSAAGHGITLAEQTGHTVEMTCAVLAAQSQHALGDHTRLEVLYIGQTFGAQGDRLAVDRLSRHSTLQRILADVADECGRDEVLLLGLTYGHAKNMLSTAGNRWVEPSATSAEEHAHWKKAGSQTFTRRDRILLAEAALINYFKPHYNLQHLDSFSTKERRRKLKTLRSLFREDFSALMVEISTSAIGAKLWSAAAPRSPGEILFTASKIAEMRANSRNTNPPMSASEFDQFIRDHVYVHIAQYALYDPTERETFLHGLHWGE